MRNSSLVERQRIDNKRALSILLKLWPYYSVIRGRRAFQQSRSSEVTRCGFVGKENVGISNVNNGENPLHRKTKVSAAMLVIRGLVGP